MAQERPVEVSVERERADAPRARTSPWPSSSTRRRRAIRSSASGGKSPRSSGATCTHSTRRSTRSGSSPSLHGSPIASTRISRFPSAS